jgi:hypothetical protein
MFPDGTNRFYNPVPIAPSETLQDPVGKLRVSTPQALIDTDFEYSLQSSKWESIGLVNNRPFAYLSPINLVGTGNTSGTPIGGVVVSGITTITMPTGSRRVTIASTTTLPPNGTPLTILDGAIPNVNGNYIITVTNANTFTITDINSGTITGSAGCTYVAAQVYNNSPWVTSFDTAAVTSGANVLQLLFPVHR